ncbi:MAG: hypothetical protein CMF41_03070 [Legionellales bacterium]|nr:hypothetical protein [Legionellales bacterium]OUX65381.1 MAG: hypothetical protein CBE41_01715 [Gammaproteobacteria bacterium TMED281]|tara:strand:- start:3510 stop:4355 length:846 start_codon:yes stop_codon:yes gene_type:complete
MSVKNSKAFVITMSGVVESGPGYEAQGEKRPPATLEDLKDLQASFKTLAHIVPLHGGSLDKPEAYVLHVINGLNELMTHPQYLYDEILNVEEENIDSFVWMFGRWLNKKARKNTNIADVGQKRDLDSKKCTIIPYSKMPNTDLLRTCINSLGIDKFKNLNAEINYYYQDGCGIGYHGDSERNIVFAINYGKPRIIQFQCYEKAKRIGDPVSIHLKCGDIYVMDGEATGTNWKKKMTQKGVRHWRHRAGDEKYILKSEKGILNKEKKRKLQREQKVAKKQKV